VVRDLVQIRLLGESKVEENRDFRRYLTARHYRIEELQQIAAEVQEQIDCTQCGNCCRHSIVTVNAGEIAQIAGYLGCEPGQVVRQYTVPDPDSHTLRQLASNSDGCVFLDGNLCTIYDVRPKACRDFPCLTLHERTLGGRLSSLSRWASLCPIIYNALEAYKHVVGYHPHRRAAANLR
jgi:Fe-S-cluster containining protein